MAIIGTKWADTLVNYSGNDFIAGLAGDDQFVLGGSVTNFVAVYGGSGNDVYTLGSDSSVLIADQSGNDTVVMPFTSTQFASSVGQSWSDHGIIEGKHYLFEMYDLTVMIMDFQGAGKIENIRFSDGVVNSFDYVWNFVKNTGLQSASISQLNTDSATKAKITAFLERYDTINAVESLYSAHETPAWFNDAVYMQNKAQQSGMSSSALSDAFLSSFYSGRDGDYIHFAQYGQWEDVSPIASFDADYYYRSKAADFFNTSISRVTTAQAQQMKTAINNSNMNAWTHYEQFGTREGIDASAQFDTSAYMEAKLAQMRRTDPGYTEDQLFDAFAAAGLSAAAHYEAYGKDEGLTAVGVPAALDVDAYDIGV